MQRFYLLLSATLFLTSAAACGGSRSTPTAPSQPPTAPSQPQSFTLSGTVTASVSTTNLPVEGATVETVDGDQAGRRAQTDAQGFYQIIGLTGNVNVRAFRAGFLEQRLGIAMTQNRTLDFQLAVREGCYPLLPPPSIVWGRTSEFTKPDGSRQTTYYIPVANRSEFPNALFESSPDAPLCVNTTASRTWAYVYVPQPAFVHCSLRSAAQLEGIWFAVPQGQARPSVYITLNDRRCDVTYKSNTLHP